MSAFDPLQTFSGPATQAAMFTYDHVVRVEADAPTEIRPGETAWVIGITPDDKKRGSHFDRFPAGTVYLVEFEGGDAIDIHENMIEPATA